MKSTHLALAAVALVSLAAATPASARMSCAGDDMMKANVMIGSMVDSPTKMMMTKEMAMANMSMSQGKMRDCNKHMMMIDHMSMMKPGS